MRYVILLLVLLGLFGWGTATILNRSALNFSGAEGLPGQSLEPPRFSGLSIVKYSDGEKSFYIKSDEASIQNRTLGFFTLGIFKIAKMKNVEMGFYQGKNLVSIINSDYAVMDLLNKDIVLYGNPRLASGPMPKQAIFKGGKIIIPCRGF